MHYRAGPGFNVPLLSSIATVEYAVRHSPPLIPKYRDTLYSAHDSLRASLHIGRADEALAQILILFSLT